MGCASSAVYLLRTSNRADMSVENRLCPSASAAEPCSRCRPQDLDSKACSPTQYQEVLKCGSTRTRTEHDEVSESGCTSARRKMGVSRRDGLITFCMPFHRQLVGCLALIVLLLVHDEKLWTAARYLEHVLLSCNTIWLSLSNLILTSNRLAGDDVRKGRNHADASPYSTVL